jgi:hypothetical protein
MVSTASEGKIDAQSEIRSCVVTSSYFFVVVVMQSGLCWLQCALLHSALQYLAFLQREHLSILVSTVPQCWHTSHSGLCVAQCCIWHSASQYQARRHPLHASIISLTLPHWLHMRWLWPTSMSTVGPAGGRKQDSWQPEQWTCLGHHTPSGR